MSSKKTDGKIRVLFVNGAKTPPLGAGPWVHGQIMRYLDRSKHSLHAATARGTRLVPAPMFDVVRDISGVTHHSIDFGPDQLGVSLKGSFREKLRVLVGIPTAVLSFAKLALLVRREKVQVLHTDERPRDAMICILLGRITGAKTIIHMHVCYGEWMTRLFKWSMKRADALVAVSSHVGETLVANGLEARRVHVVLNAIELDDWKPGVGRDAARLEFGVTAAAPVIVSVCRLLPGKGPTELVRILPAICREFPDAHLLIVGGDQTLAVGYRQQLQELAHELGVANNVILTGRRSDVPRLMAAADIFAMPSPDEPFGLVYLEAMAMKLPVVALRSGGAPEIVEHGTNGLLSEVGDLEMLSEHLLSLLRNSRLREEMGVAGRDRVERFFRSQRMASDAAQVYRSLVDSDSTSPV